jgi:uncharacterized membrane protein YedE/YeeE
MTGFSTVAEADETFPNFTQDYWEKEQDKAHGKMMRGAVLGPTGLAIAAPTAVLAIHAVDNPEQYLAFSIATGIAALGMTCHGFFSIASGIRGRDKAAYFVGQYKNNPASVRSEEERDYYIRMQKKSAGKMVLFGMVLDVQAAVLLANGIVLSVRKSNDELREGVVIWPSYLIGGILFAGGTALAIFRARRYFALDKLRSSSPAAANEVSFAPLFNVDPLTSSVQIGWSGRVTF